MTPEIGEALPAPFAMTHRWALQHPFQLGPLGTVVFRAAASGTAEQISVRGIAGGHLNFFRLGARIGRPQCLWFRRGSECAMRLLLHW